MCTILKQSDNQEIIIQEYIEGNNLALRDIINGEPFLIWLHLEFTIGQSVYVVEQGGDLPFIPLDKNYKIFVDFFSKVSKIFGIKNGPLKLDLVLDKSIGKLK